jgi:UDP-N-acetylmuramate: L-alanyl-gamma-D-glutamyl-meso-diaminopimelate ligase
MHKSLPKKVHIVGICGVATGALAVAFHEIGVSVTGSDKGFFPPVSTELESHGISFYSGWHPEKMIENGLPDVVIVGTASGSKNPETILAKEKGIPMYSFAEAIGEFFAKQNCITCVGTWGKTSSTALLSYIFEFSKMNPTYMFGGISLSHEASAKLTDSDWSIFEGDEYKSSPTDTTAKFFYYKPSHLLLTAVSWDHADLYPTEELYFSAFKKLIKNMPENGFIVAKKGQLGVEKTLYGSNKKNVWYGSDKDDAEYTYTNVSQTKNGLVFTILHKNTSSESFKISSPMIGTFQAENITGCFAMAHKSGIDPQKIIKAIASFKGLKRRLEKRFDGDITVFDDIAHSPEKASFVLENLRSIYTGKIYTIFEPNIGGRQKASAHMYDNAFKDADVVVIPRLTKLKVASNISEISESEIPLEANELTQIISKTHKNVVQFDEDDVLVQFLKQNTKKGDVIAFLGSHGFRGMIEETISNIQYPISHS